MEIIGFGFSSAGMEEFLFGDAIFGPGYHGVCIGRGRRLC